MELTAAAYSHSLLFLLLLTSLLWSTNNITSLPYISPTRTLISVSHKFYCYCFFFLNCGASWRIKVMIHHNVLLVKRLTALTFNIHEVRCIEHLLLKVGVQSAGYKAGPCVCIFSCVVVCKRGKTASRCAYSQFYLIIFWITYTGSCTLFYIFKWLSSI